MHLVEDLVVAVLQRGALLAEPVVLGDQPVGDLGVRRGYGLAWKVPTPSARELEPLGEPYRPYRTVLSWYCWRAAELYAGAAASAVTS